MYTAEIQFKNGKRGTLAYPDFYSLLTQAGEIPDQDVLAVMELLRGEGSLPRQNMLEKVQGDIRHYTRLYRLAALCFFEPRLILMRRKCKQCAHTWDGDLKTCDKCMSADSFPTHERNEGEIGPRDLAIQDLIAIQDEFFWTAATEISPFDAQDAGRAAGAALPSGDVPHDAESDHGDTGAGVGVLAE